MNIIGLASDHAGFELKEYVKTLLESKGLSYKDYGCFSEESCDYPDFAHALAKGMEANECTSGIAVCGSGEGISMTLNKHQGIRAALCWQPELAHMARLHNNANVLTMPGRYIDHETAKAIVDEFLKTEFEGVDTVKESLSNEENVYLRGFGSFILKKRAQKVARNISKNTTIVIPEHNIPAFKPAKTFMQEIIKE